MEVDIYTGSGDIGGRHPWSPSPWSLSEASLYPYLQFLFAILRRLRSSNRIELLYRKGDDFRALSNEPYWRSISTPVPEIIEEVIRGPEVPSVLRSVPIQRS